MKGRLCAAVLFAAIVLASSCAYAQRYALGESELAVKVEYLRFTDSFISDSNAESGVFVGVEAYRRLLFPDFYLGLEIGWGGSSGDVTLPFFTVASTDIDYVPLEFNAKYVFTLDPALTLGLGAGLSINYFSIETNRAFIGDERGWITGGQFFVDLNYKFSNWFLGASLKYQLTDELGGTSASADNLRIGMKAGVMF